MSVNTVLTLADARTFCAPYVEDGKLSTSSAVLDALNEATQILVEEGHWKQTIVRMKFKITNCTIAMPYNVETVLKVGFCTAPKNVFGMAYEFMASGPGILNSCNNPPGKNLVDLGDNFPTFYGIGTTPRKIALFSTETSDIGKEVRIEGMDTGKHEIAPSVPGEVVKIQRWADGTEGRIDAPSFTLSNTTWAEISHVVKPVTAGYITMMAVNEDTNEMWFMTKYLPEETRPGYRRYRITGTTFTTEEDIFALVKLRYIPLELDTDILLIQNLWALRFMCQSIHEDKHGSESRANERKAKAIERLNKQLTNSQAPGGNMFDVQVGDGSWGAAPNIR